MTVYSVFITSSGALCTFFYSLIRIEDKKLTQMDKIKCRPIAWAFFINQLTNTILIETRFNVNVFFEIRFRKLKIWKLY